MIYLSSQKHPNDMTDTERDKFVRKMVSVNLKGMRTSEIPRDHYTRFVFRYGDGTEHDTKTGETPGEVRDIRDYSIAYDMAMKEIINRESGISKEYVYSIKAEDKRAEERKKKYGKRAWRKFLTLGIPHASGAISIQRYIE